MWVKGGIVHVSYILLAATLAPRGKVNIVLSTTGSSTSAKANKVLSTPIALVASRVMVEYANNIEYTSSIEYVGQQ